MIRFEGQNLRLSRPLSDLDSFIMSFLRVLCRHCPYSIVGGFFAIMLGRTRGTEDIDLFIPRLTHEVFSSLFQDLEKAGFWCLNTREEKDAFEYLCENLAIRFSREDTSIPNVEVKFVRDELDKLSLQDTITITVDSEELVFCSPEMNIAFKQHLLKSPKDLEDAVHIGKVFEGRLDKEKIKKYKRLIEEWR